MFTGIVTHCAPVSSAEMKEGILRLVIDVPSGFTKGLERGASIAINGVCLTAIEWDDSFVSFDVIDETLNKTNLVGIQSGTLVNLERAARFGDEIGGHPLSGHIHTQAELVRVEQDEANVAMILSFEDAWKPYVISKGYIAINGCSLTIGKVEGNQFWLHLIPETLRVTNLDGMKPGTKLNIEIDHQTQVIVDTVERYMASRD
ncbi:MAG: riboflavin synthase subunit alpha [Deltaproteobacteria bacterium]|jgi:riboflavin synthase|nr:riboflavin synthase subunit alpha [Deltaproteobacteria bacterium]MBT6436135.1 riboflavin synthase subunit alpha [Deltaproteobacteria bacterium]MBT6489373.1 riboflavin synthase subunit alpha [Deltaproteobacteria bacterium]